MLEIRKDKARGDMATARGHARLVLRARAAVQQLATGSAQLNSVLMQLKEQRSTMRVVGAMAASTGVMQAMQGAMSLPATAAVARGFALEMHRAGLLQEMAADTLQDGLEVMEEAGEEDEDTLDAVIAGVLGPAAAPPAIVAPPEAAPVLAAGVTPEAAAALPSAPVHGVAAEVRLPAPSPVAAHRAALPVGAAAGGHGGDAAAASVMSDLERRLQAL